MTNRGPLHGNLPTHGHDDAHVDDSDVSDAPDDSDSPRDSDSDMDSDMDPTESPKDSPPAKKRRVVKAPAPDAPAPDAEAEKKKAAAKAKRAATAKARKEAERPFANPSLADEVVRKKKDKIMETVLAILNGDHKNMPQYIKQFGKEPEDEPMLRATHEVGYYGEYNSVKRVEGMMEKAQKLAKAFASAKACMGSINGGPEPTFEDVKKQKMFSSSTRSDVVKYEKLLDDLVRLWNTHVTKKKAFPAKKEKKRKAPMKANLQDAREKKTGRKLQKRSSPEALEQGHIERDVGRTLGKMPICVDAASMIKEEFISKYPDEAFVFYKDAPRPEASLEMKVAHFKEIAKDEIVIDHKLIDAADFKDKYGQVGRQYEQAIGSSMWLLTDAA